MQGRRLPAPDGEGFSFERSVPRTASLLPRFVAVALDFLLILVVAWIVAYGLLQVGYHPDLGGGSPERSLVGLAWLALTLELPMNLVYFTLLEGGAGTTPGKVALGLEVRQVDGGELSFLDAFVRTLLRLLWVAPGLGQAFLVADAVMVRRTEMEQRIGDKAADSVVARA